MPKVIPRMMATIIPNPKESLSSFFFSMPQRVGRTSADWTSPPSGSTTYASVVGSTVASIGGAGVKTPETGVVSLSVVAASALADAEGPGTK
jgi:hypothetical protein